MREAAVHAGLINDTPSARARVHFVTEGEVCRMIISGLIYSNGSFDGRQACITASTRVLLLKM